MQKYILGIETSCDDTSISILLNDKVVKCLTISSENKLKEFGGIIPEIASREHAINIIDIFKNLLLESNINYKEIDLIAYTSEPGLINSLHIGKIFAKTLSWYLNIKIIKINHIYAHIFSPFINKSNTIKYPFLSLIVSGGTTAIYKINSSIDICLLNKTDDDALGEAYDKIGRYLNLEYPGGPSIDKIFDENKITQKYKISKPEDNFSFSGIKSQIKNFINLNKDINIVEIASSFQYWAINNLINKIDYYSKKFNIDIVSIGGGVSANLYFRKKIQDSSLIYIFPEKEFSCDNAAMIAFLAFLYE